MVQRPAVGVVSLELRLGDILRGGGSVAGRRALLLHGLAGGLLLACWPVGDSSSRGPAGRGFLCLFLGLGFSRLGLHLRPIILPIIVSSFKGEQGSKGALPAHTAHPTHPGLFFFVLRALVASIHSSCGKEAFRSEEEKLGCKPISEHPNRLWLNRQDGWMQQAGGAWLRLLRYMQVDLGGLASA